jgi:NAD(P)-dependent dehydrogenase (short-subunit alcohol dehydrogenase family)
MTISILSAAGQCCHHGEAKRKEWMPEPTVFRARMLGKAAVVTGAGAEGDDIGIGRAIALLLAREGARVACVDLHADRAERTAALIREAGGEAIASGGDVTEISHCERFVAEAVAAFGTLDVLVNNVGVATPLSLEGVDVDQWRKLLDTNLTSAMLMCKFAVPEMASRAGGSIVNISSLAGMRAMGALAYGPSKAALHQLSREIGVLHGRQGIRANTVAPGHVMTPFAMTRLPPAAREARRKVSPLGIEGDAWDVAQAVLFLASDEARFINGVQLAVDGGVEGIGPMVGASFINEK